MKSEKKTVLIIGAGFLQVPVIKTAKRMGLNTLVLDGDQSAPGVILSDGFVHASTMDPTEALQKVKEFLGQRTLDGVLTVGTDASLTVATLSEVYGLPGISVQTAIKATNKYEMRKALRKVGVAIPDFFEVERYHEAVEIFEKLNEDCVIKPLRNMGARGIRRVNREQDLKEAFDLALSFSKDSRVIMETYIHGFELSIDALVQNGEIFITGVADRIIEYDPYFVETGHVMPSALPRDWQERAEEVFKQAIRAVGIENGAAKGDIKINETECFIGEIAARLSGGFMSTYTYPLSSGVDLMENMVLLALGEPLGDLTPQRHSVSIERAIIAAPGIIQSIDGIGEAKKISGVTDIFLRTQVGDKIKMPRNNLDKCGNVIVSAPTREEAVRISHAALRCIKIHTVEDDDQILSQDEIRKIARERFGSVCAVCEVCNGFACRGKMPGIGGVGNGSAFIRSVDIFQHYHLVPHYLHRVETPKVSTSLFGVELSLPLIPSPITGVVTNLGGAIGELKMARSIVKGANQAGTFGSVGDGATPTKYRIGLQTIFENFGQAIPFFKPRKNNEDILKRIREAEAVGALAFGIDVDSVKLVTMQNRKQITAPKSPEDLRFLVSRTSLPLVVKGILNVRDAKIAVEAGASAIVVSNHGGRVNDALVSPLEILSEIARSVDVPVILDGGVRSANDVVRALILGADLVMVGRPILIQAVGGGTQAVRQWIDKLRRELEQTLVLMGVKDICDFKFASHLLKVD